MRRNLKPPLVDLDLTPLTDMVTGTVAMLIFTLLLAVLNARHTKAQWLPGSAKDKTPSSASRSAGRTKPSGSAGSQRLASISVTTDKKEVDFFCLRNQLFYVDGQGLFKEFVSRWNHNRKSAGAPIQVGSVAAVNEVIGVPPQVVKMAIYPAAPGDESATLASPRSGLGQVLARSDRDKQCIQFLVSPDSIEVFRSARRHVESLGFEVGWKPWDGSLPLTWHVAVGPRARGYVEKTTVQRGVEEAQSMGDSL